LLLGDAAFAVGVFAVISVAITADTPAAGTDVRHLDAYAYLFAAGLGALMFVRRAYPISTLLATVAGTIAYYVCQYPPIGLAIPMGAALYAAAEAGRMRWAAGSAAIMLGLSLYFRIAQGEHVRYLLLYDTLLTIAVMAVAVGFGAARRAQDLWRSEAQERARQASIVLEQEARERVAQERVRIARDLHDSLAHTISVIALHAEVATESDAHLPDATRAALCRITQASRRAMSELRSAVGVLRMPESQTPTPALGDVLLLASDLAGDGLDVTVHVSGDLDQIPPFVGATAYRIVQESLTNAIRHGRSRHATVALTLSEAVLAIEVRDDGCGAEPASQAQGHGIRSMTERAQILGGTLHAGPRSGGRGWLVTATLPTERS